MSSKIWIVAGIVFVGLTILTLRPVPIPEENDCLIINGSVLQIYEAGTKDVVFKLQGQDKTFYVNRGQERGLDLDKLKTELINKEITIKYPKYWTPFMLIGPVSLHISKIEYGGKTIFSEIN